VYFSCVAVTKIVLFIPPLYCLFWVWVQERAHFSSLKRAHFSCSAIFTLIRPLPKHKTYEKHTNHTHRRTCDREREAPICKTSCEILCIIIYPSDKKQKFRESSCRCDSLDNIRKDKTLSPLLRVVLFVKCPHRRCYIIGLETHQPAFCRPPSLFCRGEMRRLSQMSCSRESYYQLEKGRNNQLNHRRWIFSSKASEPFPKHVFISDDPGRFWSMHGWKNQ